MEYVFGFAGIGADVYDRLHTKLVVSSSDNIKLIGSPLIRGEQTYTYNDTIGLRKKFTRVLAVDAKTMEPTAKAYCLIRVELDEQSTSRLVQDFFPELLVITIRWTLDSKTETKKKRQINKLIQKIREAMKNAKTTLRALRKELNEKSNRTPLLLPVKNFKSSVFTQQLSILSKDLPTTREADQAIRTFSTLIINIIHRRLINLGCEKPHLNIATNDFVRL